MRTILKSKIHRATVTGSDLEYEGSLTLDPGLMEAADILPFEMVHVLDISNGSRLQTYVIEGERGSGEVVINGAAARLVQQGDMVIVLSYVQLQEEDCRRWRPKLVYVDEANRIVRTASEVALAGTGA